MRGGGGEGGGGLGHALEACKNFLCTAVSGGSIGAVRGGGVGRTTSTAYRPPMPPPPPSPPTPPPRTAPTASTHCCTYKVLTGLQCMPKPLRPHHPTTTPTALTAYTPTRTARTASTHCCTCVPKPFPSTHCCTYRPPMRAQTPSATALTAYIPTPHAPGLQCVPKPPPPPPPPSPPLLPPLTAVDRKFLQACPNPLRPHHPHRPPPRTASLL